MPDCDYCDSHIEVPDDGDEQPYLTHLAEEHAESVSRVDEKKLENTWDGDFGAVQEENHRFKPSTMALGAASAVFVVGLAVAAVMGWSPPADDGGGGQDREWIYESGEMNVIVDGEEVSPSEINGTEYFYVENETGNWRMSVPESFRYTVGDALHGLDLVTEPDQPTEVHPTYAQGRSVEMSVTVNGEPAPLNQTLQRGQNITFVVEETE